MRRALALLAVVAACVVGALAIGAGGGNGARTYEIVLDNAFGVTKGGDFKIAGVKAGKTEAMHIEGQAHPVAVVEAKVTQSGQADLRADAQCEVRPQSFIGEYFIDCQPGNSPRRLPGGRVPLSQTSSTIPFDLVNNILRRPYRDRLRLIVGELGAGLAGRPGDLSAVLRRAHPALRETSETLQILGKQTKTIERFIGNAHTVIGALENRKQDVVRFVHEAGHTAEVSASRRVALGETFHRLPAFLAELEPYMNRLGDLTQAQTPVLRNLQASSDELETFLTRLRPFTAEGLPAFKALGQMSVVGKRAVVKTSAEVTELRRLAKDAPGFAKPLRQFLQTIDDRKRAVEADRRAAATGPPAGDKTHTTSSRAGFTGMEAIWNFFFWQTLSTNALDDIGHVLRLGIVVNQCSTYQVKPSPALLDRCAQFLGPTQPGVTTPDPTRTGAAPASAAPPAAPASSTPPASSAPPTSPATAPGQAPTKSTTESALDFLLGK